MQSENGVFAFIPEAQPNLGEAKLAQAERKAKRKRSFCFHSRGAARCGAAPRAGETRFIASLTARMAHTAAGNVDAGLRPERVRRDESRLYVADVPCGWGKGACRAAADPIGVALLITAGKRSAPADRSPTLLRPHGGRTSSRRRAGGRDA